MSGLNDLNFRETGYSSLQTKEELQIKIDKTCHYDVIRESYWESLKESDICFIVFKNIIKNNFNYENPSKNQIKDLFFFMPIEFLGLSLIYGGFDKYRVFEKIQEFIDDEYPLIVGLLIREE